MNEPECMCHVRDDPWCQLCHPEAWADPDWIGSPARREAHDYGDDRKWHQEL